jgi:hypothetical protein
VRNLPRQRDALHWTRHHFCIIPVFSKLKTELRRAWFGYAGELLAAVNGSATVFFFPSGSRTLSPPPSNPYRPSRGQRLWIADTPWRVFLLKSPSALGKLCPWSSAIWEFLILNYFKLKLILVYLQKCHFIVLLINRHFNSDLTRSTCVRFVIS